MRRPCRETVAAIVFAVVCVSAVMSGWAGEGSALSPEDVGRLAGGRPVVLAPLVEEPPVVDGNPEDAAWKLARPVTFRFMNAERTDAPKHKTSARAVCDREHLYVLFECEESNIAGLKTSSPALWMDDVCDLFLDVGRTLDIASGAYFSMQVNPKGRFHAIRGDGKPWPLSGTVAKGSVGADRWFAEFKVAFRDLGLDAGNFPKVWGVNFSRTRCADKKEGEETPGDDNEFAWIGNYVDTPHTPDRFGLLLLGVGNALPRDLAEAMRRDGRDPAAMGIKTWEPPREAPADIPPVPARKSAFARKPSVAKVEGGLAVEFEAEEETDATVTIWGPDGKAVRHLAAGLLGNNAPVPFSKGSKSQRVVWDMKDDFGRPVPPGNYTVKVGLGLKASLDRAVAGDPQRVPEVVGLAVGPDGTLYVLAVERGGHYRAGFI
ncbi:MAG: hypothetical protein N3A38_01220, partial [Planctomycetota bacterium]|nr:hypothetical protein [Planctomycetota bacterium]